MSSRQTHAALTNTDKYRRVYDWEHYMIRDHLRIEQWIDGLYVTGFIFLG